MFEWAVAGRKNHSSQWYITAGIVVLSLVVMGIYMRIQALSVVVVLLAGVYIMLENNGPDEILVQVGDVGINIGNQMFDYGQIEEFAFIFDGIVAKQLKLRLKSSSIKSLEIDLTNIDYNVADLRAHLLNYIPEGEGGEITLTEKIANSLGL